MTARDHARTRERAIRPESRQPVDARRQRRRVWTYGAGLASALLIVARFARVPAIEQPDGSAVSPGLVLERTEGRLLLSPILSVVEQLALLPARAHLAIGATIVLSAWGLGALRGRQEGSWKRALARSCRSSARVAGAMVVVYAAGALLPWPMASLRHDDRDVAVDFHSHTSRSHDGRWDFTVARNAEWHRAGGFDVAYVTDHADSAAVSALPRATDRFSTIILAGAEFRSAGVHVVRLGEPSDTSAIFLLTAPFPVNASDRLLRARMPVSAIEALDASPRGLQWGNEHANELRRASAQLAATPVAVSNQHGWGRTAAAWTLLTLPGWQSNSPSWLDARIRALLRAGDASRVRIVRRHSAGSFTSGFALASVVPVVLWTTLRTLDDAEYVVWALWIWTPILAGVGIDVVLRLTRRLTRRLARPIEIGLAADVPAEGEGEAA